MKNGKTAAKSPRLAKISTLVWVVAFLLPSLPSWAGNSNVLTAGSAHTCGLKTDGTVVCWGRDYEGQSTPPSGTFTQISAGIFHNCGIKTDGTLSCWGNNNSGQSSPPPGTFLQVAAGGDHSCALKTDSTIICWGANYDSQSSPLSGTLTQITAGDYFNCGLKANGTLECWGNAPTAPSNNFTYISAGYSTVCGLKTDGTGTCWGSYSRDTLGFLSQLDSSGYGKVCGIKTDNTVECWGLSNDPQSGTFTYVVVGTDHACGIRDNGVVACWGSNNYGQATPPTGITFKQPNSGTVVTPPSTCTQMELDAQYNAGYQAGLAAGSGGGASPIKLINISTRASVLGGANDVIAGFIIEGTGSQKVLIRGWGIATGVDVALSLQKYPSGDPIANNNNWQTQTAPSTTIPTQWAMPQVTDSALLLTLPAGAYTAILSAGVKKGMGLIGVNAID
jgi:hypothetical protein